MPTTTLSNLVERLLESKAALCKEAADAIMNQQDIIDNLQDEIRIIHEQGTER